MKIQFLNSPVFYYSGFHYRMLPPLSLPILAAVLSNAGHYAETIDLEALAISPDMLREAYSKQRDNWPDVIGLTGLTVAAQGMRESIAALREADFGGRIVVGGVHATLNPQEVLSWGADLVVTGECEGNIVQLFEGGVTGIYAGKRMAIEDIPAPDWTHHNPELWTYQGNMGILRPNPGISMWTRGCPYACIFCSDIIFGHQATRYRPPVNIEAEMADLKRRGCKNLFIYDDELIGGKMPDGWMTEVADRVGPMGFHWVTQGRCSKKHITLELMRDLKRAGCRAVFWGVESFSPKVLRAIKKATTPDDIWHTLRVSCEAGIENGVFMMVGNYQETENDLQITADEMGKAYDAGLIQYRQTTVCTPMPGTELARLAQAEGWYVEAPNGGRQMMQVMNEGTPWLNRAQIEKWMQKFREVCPAEIPQ